jgi:hypothetical protein
LGVPYSTYSQSISIINENGVTDIEFAAIKKIEFTPELQTDEYDCPGIIIYKDGLEEVVNFSIGSFFYEYIEFFCPYHYSFRLGNSVSIDQYLYTDVVRTQFSEVKSIEFDV